MRLIFRGVATLWGSDAVVREPGASGAQGVATPAKIRRSGLTRRASG